MMVEGGDERPPNTVVVGDERLEQELEVWRMREGMMRGLYDAVVNWKEDEREQEEKKLEETSEETDRNAEATKSAFAASATAVLVGAFVIRLGGRAALVSVLGLDLVADLGLDEQINSAIEYADALGGLAVVGFILAWVVAKVFLVDVLSIALAFSSGVIFGGVFKGAIISAAGATLGSLTAFLLSRTLLQERVEGAIEKQPVARALAKVVEEDGFKTVFVLRLAPIIPIPLGTYAYIYGASKVNPLVFSAATFLGSLKPYLLDSYLGVFSKQLLDGDTLDDSKDLILLFGLGALVLVGVFANDLAGESWELVQQEMKADKKRLLEEGVPSEEDADGAEKQGWGGMVGPFNTSAPAGFVGRITPDAVQDELGEVWRELGTYLDGQWAPAARLAVEERQKRLEENGELEGNAVERLLGSLATPAEPAEPAKPVVPSAAADEAPGSVAELLYGKDTASEAEAAARRRVAAWSLAGPQPWRQVVLSLLFTFALLDATRSKWASYPEDRAGLERLLNGTQAAIMGATAMEAAGGAAAEGATAAAAAAGAAAIAATPPTSDLESDVAAALSAEEAATANRERGQEIAARLERIEQQTAALSAEEAATANRERGQEIAARLERIEQQLKALPGDAD